MPEDKRAARLKKITDAAAAPRNWTKTCPRAYGRYLDAHKNLLRSLAPLPDLYFDSVIESAGVALAMAWSAGQDSVKEIEEKTCGAPPEECCNNPKACKWG